MALDWREILEFYIPISAPSLQFLFYIPNNILHSSSSIFQAFARLLFPYLISATTPTQPTLTLVKVMGTLGALASFRFPSPLTVIFFK